MPSGFIMGDIKGVVMHPDNDVSEQGCIICSSDEVAIITKNWEQDSKSSGIMSIPSNEVWFQTQNGAYYDPMYVQVEEEQGDTFPDLPTFDREKTQAANTGSGHIYKWVFTGDVTRINDGSTGMFTEDDYYSAALPISKVFLPVNYWQNTSELEACLFLYCSDLESFTIPNSVTSIGDYAFQFCYSLTSITIPNSVVSIGEYAFHKCTSLISITIPNSVTSIGGNAFSYCSALTSITIPNSVTSIGNYAFYQCCTLTSVTIPNSVTEIRGHAFSGCSSLTSITIPNSVTSIGNNAFFGCFKYASSVCTVELPNNITSIGKCAFDNCSFLYCIKVGDNPYYSDPNGMITIQLANGNTYTYSGCMSGAECVLPGTQVLTSLDGTTKSVEELNIGDQVVTYNNGEMVEAPIDKVVNVVHNDYITLTLENDTTLSLSTDHAIKTMNGWKAYNPAITEVPDNVGTLTVDDHVLTNNGYIKINNIEYVNKPNTTMYNIGIKNHNDYFANGICVYECSGSN